MFLKNGKKKLMTDRIINIITPHYLSIRNHFVAGMAKIDPRKIEKYKIFEYCFVFIFTIAMSSYGIWLATIDHDANVKNIQPIFFLDHENSNTPSDSEKIIISYYGIPFKELHLNEFTFLELRYTDPITNKYIYSKLPLVAYYDLGELHQNNLIEGYYKMSSKVTYNFIKRVRLWFYKNVDPNAYIDTSSYIVIKYTDAYNIQREYYHKFDHIPKTLLDENVGKDILNYYNEEFKYSNIPFLPKNESEDITDFSSKMYNNSKQFANIYKDPYYI